MLAQKDNPIYLFLLRSIYHVNIKLYIYTEVMITKNEINVIVKYKNGKCIQIDTVRQ